MKQFLFSVWLSLIGAVAVSAATNTNPATLFINDNQVISPPDTAPNINATSWDNRALFSVTDTSLLGIPLPFEALNNAFFTNDNIMIGNPGFRFTKNVGGKRFWMDTWTNSGTIATDSSLSGLNTLGTVVGIANSQYSILLVQATNIGNSGTLRSGSEGLIRLEGNNVNVKRVGLRTGAGAATNGIFLGGGGFLLSSNYVNDFGITDVWWGAGTNNYLGTNGRPIRIDGFGIFPQFSVPNPESPQHQVIEASIGGIGLPFTNLVFLPFFNSGIPFTAAVWTNQTSPTNFVIQVVFYPTNSLTDTNFSIDVQFEPDVSGASIPVVAFSSTDFDIVDRVNSTTTVYLSDALATVPSAFLARNSGANTSRPDTYEISYTPPFFFGLGGGFTSPANAVFDTNLIWNPSYQFNTVTNMYAAYQAQVASVTSAFVASGGDPTNFPGRVEIIGQQVNLDQTRVRAESAFNLKVTQNLASNRLAQIDAPWVDFDVRSLAPSLIISNIAPATVHRFSANIACWSGTWNNYTTSANGTTNQILFHVLMVDPSIQSVQSVVVDRFAAHATNVVIYDTLNIGQSFLADGQGLDVKGGVILPAGVGWAATNIQNVLHFTNEGIVTVQQIANAGADRPVPYYDFINRGTNTAATYFIRASNFVNNGVLGATGGRFQLDALSASMMGTPLTVFSNSYYFTNIFYDFTNRVFLTNVIGITNVFTNDYGASIQGNAEVDIFARDLVVSNSLLQARGQLVFSVTNSLMDSGQDGINNWSAANGFQMQQLPANSDLLATHLRSVASGFFQQSFHVWCAENRGTTVSGYSNNLALGKLTLDGAFGALFSFLPPAGQTDKALYVDYLELLNSATNYNSALDISPDMTIYFANSNINPEKLGHSNGGRLRWVSQFAGPLSSTNITYPSGTTYTFNIALVQSRDIDSDGDGIVNALDPTPIFVADSLAFGISLTNGPPPEVLFSWYSLAGSTSHLEYVPFLGSSDWVTVTNIINGPTSGILRAQDALSGDGTRFYRLRVDLPNP